MIRCYWILQLYFFCVIMTIWSCITHYLHIIEYVEFDDKQRTFIWKDGEIYNFHNLSFIFSLFADLIVTNRYGSRHRVSSYRAHKTFSFAVLTCWCCCWPDALTVSSSHLLGTFLQRGESLAYAFSKLAQGICSTPTIRTPIYYFTIPLKGIGLNKINEYSSKGIFRETIFRIFP